MRVWRSEPLAKNPRTHTTNDKQATSAPTGHTSDTSTAFSSPRHRSMGRLAKHKAAKAASKRRKKSGPSSSTSSSSSSLSRRPGASHVLGDSVALAVAAASPMNTTGSTSGSSTPSSGKECEQCGNPTVLEGVATARAWTSAGKKQPAPLAASGGCQICDFVLYRKSLRPCVHCDRVNCEHFCEWCGNGYHTKCARVRDEKVNAPTGFCCRKCEAEQADDDDSASASGERSDEEEELGSKCGTCRLPFNATARENEAGFKVNQSVLVENDEVLYNAVITDVDLKGERVKIHFLRWSKSFDNWYAMDDEHINESLACDCCNHWFHIGCLPPIKSSGRFKDTTYVCPSCIDDAKHFHNGTRPKAKATTSSSSSSSASTNSKASAQKNSVSEDAGPGLATGVPKRKSAKPIVSSDDEQEDVKRPSAKKKRKLSVSSDSPGKKKPELSRATSRSKSPDSAAASSEVVRATASRGGDNEDDGKDDNDDELVPDNESSTEKSTSSVPASPSASASKGAHEDAAAVTAASLSANSSKKAPNTKEKLSLSTPSPSDSEATEQSKENEAGDKTAPPANNFHRRKPSSHSVSALLNSPSPNEKPATPPVHANVGSLSMLDDGRRNLTTSFDVSVKMERHSQQLPPLPSSFATRLSSSSKAVAKIEPYQSTSNWPIRPAAQSKPQSSSGSRGPLSAFDILREVASQSIAGELDVVSASAAPAKPKKEPRARSTAAKAKAAKADKAAAAEKVSASKGGSSGLGPASTATTAEQDRQFLQSKERVHLNSFVDLHFNIRKEMYLKFCMLEEQGLLDRDTAQLLRSLIYPTSDKFQDLKFVYLVNKDLSPLYLTKRLLEVVPSSQGGTGGALPAPRASDVSGSRSVASSPASTSHPTLSVTPSLPSMVPPGLTIPSFSEIIASEKASALLQQQHQHQQLQQQLNQHRQTQLQLQQQLQQQLKRPSPSSATSASRAASSSASLEKKRPEVIALELATPVAPPTAVPSSSASTSTPTPSAPLSSSSSTPPTSSVSTVQSQPA